MGGIAAAGGIQAGGRPGIPGSGIPVGGKSGAPVGGIIGTPLGGKNEICGIGMVAGTK